MNGRNDWDDYTTEELWDFLIDRDGVIAKQAARIRELEAEQAWVDMKAERMCAELAWATELDGLML